MATSSAKPGLTPVPNSVEPPALARLDEAVAVGAEAAPVDERRGGDDVDPGLEDADQLVDRRPHRVVHDAVGLQPEQQVDVVRGGDAEGVDADQLPDVDAHLGVGPGVATDQLEVRVGDDRLDRFLADVARRPLHDTDGHLFPLGRRRVLCRCTARAQSLHQGLVDDKPARRGS